MEEEGGRPSGNLGMSLGKDPAQTPARPGAQQNDGDPDEAERSAPKQAGQFTVKDADEEQSRRDKKKAAPRPVSGQRSGFMADHFLVDDGLEERARVAGRIAQLEPVCPDVEGQLAKVLRHDVVASVEQRPGAERPD